MAIRKTALVLGGGGMFGAYEAGVWKALAPRWLPDLVVGASIGAVNGWAIAGRCDPDEWIEEWLHLEQVERHRYKFPWPPTEGMIDCRELEKFLQKIHARYSPQVEYALTATGLPGLKPCVFRAPQITWQHLAASCAVPVLMKQYWIEGRRYSDGGLLGAVPLWAAIECGATHVVAVNILPRGGGWLKAIQATLRLAGRQRRGSPTAIPWMMLEHAVPLGPIADSMYWRREKAERMIECGRRDAEAAWGEIARVLEIPVD